MKKLLILPALLLASCAPLLSAITPHLILSALPSALQYAQGEKALLTDSGTAVTLTNGDTAALDGASITLDGAVTATGGDCRPAGSHSIACSIGAIPGTVDGKAYSFVVQYTGTLKGKSSAFYRMKSGARPIFIQGQ